MLRSQNRSAENPPIFSAMRAGTCRAMTSSGTSANQTAPVHSSGGIAAYSSSPDAAAQAAAIHSVRLEGTIFIGPPILPRRARPAIFDFARRATRRPLRFGASFRVSERKGQPHAEAWTTYQTRS